MPWTKAIKFLLEVKSEMERVSWPKRDQTIRLTILVIAFTLGVGLYIGALDALFTKLASTFFIR